MLDDHGTLRDADGNPKSYRVLHASLPSVPLAESQIWPEDLLMVNVLRNGHVVQEFPRGGQRSQAEFYAQHIEARTTKRLGFVSCSANHAALDAKCPACGAVR